MTDDERHRITVFLSQNPEAGALIKGTGGARKVRFPLSGRGKSGGCRVITYYCAEDIPVFLLDVFSKTEKINMSQKERNELKTILASLAEEYRASTSRVTKELGRAS